MRTLHLVVATLAVAALAGCASTGSSAGDATLRAEIEAANRRLEDRMRANDLAGVAAMYADHALLLSPGGEPVQGRAAIDAYWRRFGRGIDWRLEVRRVEGREGLAVQRGVSTLTYEKRGEVRTSRVDFVLVWEKDDDGTWKVAVDGYW